MPNRLANETSPYLRQHADNPVDWYPWSAEALQRARDENRPILLSIGYAACHWCHVMAHESFEDAATAALMNDLFVNIKVDREERPDIDAIYMQAVQAMTGHGGWPLTAFLTPEGVPFYTGTYFPKEDRYGMPSFRRVLSAVAEAFRDRRADVARTAESIRDMFAAAETPTRSSGVLTTELLERAWRTIAAGFDAEHGGFGGAPKFPQPMTLDFVLQHWARTGDSAALDLVTASFRHMARGGIYDQVGGGFARYAVDAAWQVPHFEKMLYDNALLARLGVHLSQATGDAEVRRVTEETLDWMAREMVSPDGAFHASLDADSEGHEGKFYLWDVSQIDALLGDDAPLAKAFWGATDEGNFEGRNILHVPHDADVLAKRHGVTRDHLDAVIARAKRLLYRARAERVWPGKDDKVIASWNGLALRAIAEAARAFGRADYRAIAERTGDFLFRELVRGGRVHRSFGGGAPRVPGFLEDYGAVALGALALYELSFDTVWLERARELADAAVEWFWDDDIGAFFDTPRDHEALITRPREVTDNAIPSGTSLTAELLVRLGELLHDVDLQRRATYVVETLAEPMARYPMAFGHLLGVTDMLVRGAVEVAVVGDATARDFRALVDAVAGTYVPALVLAGGPPDDASSIALLADRPMREGRTTAYVCRQYACQEPVTEPEALRRQLRDAARA